MRAVKRKRSVASARRQYAPVWITPAELLSEGLLVSPRMFLDHLPDVSSLALADTAKRMVRALLIVYFIMTFSYGVTTFTVIGVIHGHIRELCTSHLLPAQTD